MSVTKSEVRPGAYYDSVVLMQLQRALANLPEVIDAGVVMATPANCSLLAASDLLVESGATSDDLLIVVKAADSEAADNALSQVDTLLARRRSGAGADFRPRSLEMATRQLPEAAWVLISVPGRYAANVARQALDLGRHVFIYSDNVSIEDEQDLKQKSRDKGLLVMGPDCGTSIIGGVGFGFANRVRRGPIGLVGASGTGLQAITSHIHHLGMGISQAIGTGGRDLSAAVGAITTHQALRLLDRDANTEAIVLVSKPPEPLVAATLLAAARRCHKPVIVDFIGYAPPSRQLGNLWFASSLGDAATLAVDLAQESGVTKERNGESDNSGKYIRGLFSGGTLAYEALLGLQAFLDPVYANLRLDSVRPLKDITKSQAHTILDMGDDTFTQGRLHPMMDNELRLRRLDQEASDPEVGLILLDLVLGEGAHPDPAGELGPAIAKAKATAAEARRNLDVVVIAIGTDEDPQSLASQVETLQAAGAIVFEDTAPAIAYITERGDEGRRQGFPDVAPEALYGTVAAINVGLEIFHDSLVAQGAKVVQVDWRPPAGGDEKLIALLAKMK